MAKANQKVSGAGNPRQQGLHTLQDLPFVPWFFHKLDPESGFEQAEQSNELESL